MFAAPAGFAHAEQVSSFYADAFYPEGAVQCCTPAALMESGDIWELQRCNCTQVGGCRGGQQATV